ncbi:hypothetical protein AB0A71_39165 [Kitasatospora aureofaciens]|uniref:hypothetical protein n=1 Tax=Kitasatospora aureofaciens TaxID=1894 RepID=UPI0033F737FD
MAQTTMRWAVRNGCWTFGVPDLEALVQATKPYTMACIADRITCPTLVLEAENDQFFAGQPQRVFDDLTCRKELVTFREGEGAGEHCHEGALRRLARAQVVGASASGGNGRERADPASLLLRIAPAGTRLGEPQPRLVDVGSDGRQLRLGFVRPWLDCCS